MTFTSPPLTFLYNTWTLPNTLKVFDDFLQGNWKMHHFSWWGVGWWEWRTSWAKRLHLLPSLCDCVPAGSHCDVHVLLQDRAAQDKCWEYQETSQESFLRQSWWQGHRVFVARGDDGGAGGQPEEEVGNLLSECPACHPILYQIMSPVFINCHRKYIRLVIVIV